MAYLSDGTHSFPRVDHYAILDGGIGTLASVRVRMLRTVCNIVGTLFGSMPRHPVMIFRGLELKSKMIMLFE